jgi:hypothetical protein|nr:hypothetical protein [Kofleriaceae bacterium]
MALVLAVALLVGAAAVGYALLDATWFTFDDTWEHVELSFHETAQLHGGMQYWADIAILVAAAGLYMVRVGSLVISLVLARPTPFQWARSSHSIAHAGVLAAYGVIVLLWSPSTWLWSSDYFARGPGPLWLFGGLALVQVVVLVVHGRARYDLDVAAAATATPGPKPRPMIKAPLLGPASVDADPFRGAPRPVIHVQAVTPARSSPRADTADPTVEPPKLLT